MGTKIEEALLEELTNIRRLLIFSLLRSGATQSQVAGALGTSQSQISKMFPKTSKGTVEPRQ